MAAAKSTVSKPILIAAALVFALFGVFFVMLTMEGRDTAAIPSVLIGKSAPETNLPAIDGTGLPAFNNETLIGKVSVVNVWASWCAPCRQEHPFLIDLAKDERIQVVGFNYKDKPANAAAFLSELGNPYDAAGQDQTGRTAINWGVYGVPETFIVDAQGTIRFKHVGPISTEALERDIKPMIETLLAGS